MGLKARLFLVFGVTIICYGLITFFVPSYIIKKDLGEETKHIEQLLFKKDERLLHAQQVLLGDVFERIRENINSYLFIIYDLPKLQQMLSFPAKGSPNYKQGIIETWQALVQIASYDPDIGFLQVNSLDGSQVAVLKPADAYLYPTKSSHLDDHLLTVEVQSKAEAQKQYIAVPLHEIFSDDQQYDYYILVPKMIPKDDLESVESNIHQFEKSYKKKVNLGVGQIFIDPENKILSAQTWAIKNQLLQVLVPLVVENTMDYAKQEWIPAGIARYEKGNLETGQAMMTGEIIEVKSVVDAEGYFNKHLPIQDSPALAQGTLFITEPGFNHIYLANTLKTPSFYLTVGTPIDPLAKQLAIWTDRDVVIRVNNQLWIGYDSSTVVYNTNAIRQVLNVSNLNKKSGAIEIQGKIYLYEKLADLQNGELGFYEITPINATSTIETYTFTAAKSAAWKISAQLFLFSLIIILVIFFTMTRFALHNIRPVEKLAEATKFIVEGRYGEVVMPEIGKRKDEVATLTHAFEDMVKGLQEKEKIRGVLDIVISKEVANEILKSNIHLGGEDRDVTVLFADIRGFTALTEKLAPQETIGILNGVMTKVTHIIETEGGVVDKYIGDEVMGIFGAPTTCEEHPLRAVSAGLMMLKAIAKWNEERVKNGEFPIGLGIGINTGIAVAGNMGAEDRLNYTVLGSNVNLASRVCDYAKPSELIITENTFIQGKIEDHFHYEALPPATLKGFSKQINVYRIIDFKWDKE